MPDQLAVHTCPYLGLPNDRASHYAEPSDAHRCYSPTRPGMVDLDHQVKFCFSAAFPSCKRFVELPRPAAASTGPGKPQGAAGRPTKGAAAARPRDPQPAASDRPPARSLVENPLEVGLWALAIILAALALYSIWPLLSSRSESSASVIVPSRTASPISSKTGTPTATPTSTPTATGTPLPTLAPLAVPTTPAEGVLLTLSPDPSRSGWVGSKELAPHWGDRNLHSGVFQTQVYTSVLDFDLENLPPKSQILYAALELTGRNSTHLATGGQWQLQLLNAAETKDWARASNDDIARVTPLGTVGRPLASSELAVGYTNRVTFDDSQLQLLAQQLNYGRVTLLLEGPTGTSDDLFTWDGGSGTSGGLNAPALYLVVIPGRYTVITNTPTPANVLTAAAYSLAQTAFARRYGTPTPFGPGVVTATPGGGIVLVPAPPLPGNAATAQALSALATAVAITTGTYTPTPRNVVLVYPTSTPVSLGLDQIIIPPTPTSPGSLDYLATPIPDAWKGKILISTNRYGPQYANLPVALNPDGTPWQILTSNDLYYRAAAREQYSPDRQQKADYLVDSNGIQQISIRDVNTGVLSAVTHLSKGTAYDVVWSPDGASLAFVSTETGQDEIYIYDIGSRTLRQITFSGASQPWNKHPSWSPDSQKLVFWSSRTGNPQIWVMDRNGQGLSNLSSNAFTEQNPIWVK